MTRWIVPSHTSHLMTSRSLSSFECRVDTTWRSTVLLFCWLTVASLRKQQSFCQLRGAMVNCIDEYLAPLESLLQEMGYQGEELSAVHRIWDLTLTNLRKHIATQSHELHQTVSFMGRDIRIHREYYRLPNDVFQTAKVAKILLAMEKGEISSVQGKPLDDRVCPDDAVSEWVDS